jgi:type IV pilus assembly protein PilB
MPGSVPNKQERRDEPVSGWTATSEDEFLASVPPKGPVVAAFDPAGYVIDPKVVKAISLEIARKYKVLPLSRMGNVLQVAMVDPSNYRALDDLKFITGCNIEPLRGAESSIMDCIEFAYNVSEKEVNETLGGDINSVLAEIGGDLNDVEDEGDASEEISLEEMEAAAGEAPIIRLVNGILREAVMAGASDVHLEPYEKEYRVRFRVDGVLEEFMKPPLKARDAIVSRIKILARLDISEKRLPQDGRIMIALRVNGKKRVLDWRVSTLPTLWGEKIVLRLLDKDQLRLDMTQLGFEPESLEKFQKAILKPYGMVLVTGPTGSGKTNTLYSSISLLNKPDTNIMTAEDPIEFQLHGVNQVQMKEQIGLNFAAALRSFLRQDPNIILVGEIRDFETAEIAIKAALTGHLVLSTLHTNGAPETISRLMNMGIEPFLVATSIHLIVAQRLIRRICTGCIHQVEVPMNVLNKIGFTVEEARTVKVMKGRGCDRCNGTGYKGRTALYEVMEIDDTLRELILIGASSMELKKKAMEQGMITLRRSGLRKIMAGLTTMDEVLRETVL